jgi:hypothetical protein
MEEEEEDEDEKPWPSRRLLFNGKKNRDAIWIHRFRRCEVQDFLESLVVRSNANNFISFNESLRSVDFRQKDLEEDSKKNKNKNKERSRSS